MVKHLTLIEWDERATFQITNINSSSNDSQSMNYQFTHKSPITPFIRVIQLTQVTQKNTIYIRNKIQFIASYNVLNWWKLKMCRKMFSIVWLLFVVHSKSEDNCNLVINEIDTGSPANVKNQVFIEIKILCENIKHWIDEEEERQNENKNNHVLYEKKSFNSESSQ